MATLHINCLGAFQASCDGDPLAFETDKARALLAYLAAETSQPQRRERLAGLLWSDVPEERALHNLRQALSGLRKALRDENSAVPFLLIRRETVQVNPQSDIRLDIAIFEQEIAAALHRYQHHSPHTKVDRRLNVRRLQQAIALFRGPFLDQMYLNGSPLFDEWASLRREATTRRMLEALTILAELHERRNEIGAARQYAAQIASLAPWDELAQARVMRLLAGEGQWSAAQAQYHHLRRSLQAQLGVEPAAETVALYEDIRRSASQNTPFAALSSPASHNLPLPMTSFIGRASELDRLCELLADPCCRLLTLLGPGGVGKTRLAIETARQQVGIFCDGVYFVPLSAVASADLLPGALADGLGFTFYSEQTGADQLLHFVEKKHMLWVLDNLEQLLPLPADSLISRVIQQSPGVTIVATSRQRLNLQEEHIFQVEGLPYPASSDASEPAGLESLQLFTSRAQRVQPHFDLADHANCRAAALICRLVEGLPLGIELAAAGLWSRTVAEIAGSLHDTLHSLESTAVDASERHRSLRAVFEVSWARLSAEEQAALARLSVFRGGFEAEMASQALEIPAGLLAALLDKSLLRRNATGRYDLHEAIRQFAAEKLAGDAAQFSFAHDSHARSFAAFLAARTQALKSAGQLQALTEIGLEWENARQALNRLVQQGWTEVAAACIESVFHYCNICTRYPEGLDIFDRVVQALPKESAAQAKALTFQGALAYRILDHTLCERAITQALALYETLNAPGDQALCLVFASALAYRQKDRRRARQLCEHSLALYDQIGDPWGQAYALYQLGLLESRAGRVPEAQAAMHASLQSAQTAGDTRRQIGPLNLLGDLACQLGRYDEAQAYFEESLAISRSLGDRYNIALAENNLGTAFHYTGHHDRARRCYKESLAVAGEIGDLGAQSLASSNLGELALVGQQFAVARTHFQQALALAKKAGDEWAELIGWINLADAALGLDDQTAAGQYLTQALPLAARSGEPALVLRAFLHQGRLYLKQGESQKGIALLGLVFYHEATYDEHRQAARQVLEQAGLAIPAKNNLTIAAALQEVQKNALRF
ncbi:MAG: AfsR/SARP family transcriptional regulator [Chloroflexota bacterium]